MAALAPTVGLHGSVSKVSKIFVSDMFDFGQMREQLDFPDRVVPGWFGHGLSLPPDSGVGLGSTERTGEKGEACCKQSTLRPTTLHPARRKRRAGGRMTTDFDLEADLESERTQRGTPPKRALFGRGCRGSESPTDDLAEAQAGWSATISRSGLTLPEWGFLIQSHAYRGKWKICVRILCSTTPGGAILTSALAPDHFYVNCFVLRFAGSTSWDQYRQVLDAIVVSNGWDDATAALQLLSHLEGDALNVALLVPANRRALRVGLVDALTAHYGSPGRLADYRRQFERVTRATEQDSCALGRHLDSVSPETIQDIVDRCRVWESHADLEDQRGTMRVCSPVIAYISDVPRGSDEGTQSGADPFFPAQYVSSPVSGIYVGCCGYFGIFDTCCGAVTPVWSLGHLFSTRSRIALFCCSGIADGVLSNAVGA